MRRFSREISRTIDGRLVDISPLTEGKGVRVWDGKAWGKPSITVGAVTESKPLAEEEIRALVEAGILEKKFLQDDMLC